MVKRKRIRNYLDKQLNGLQTNLNGMGKEMDSDKLHDLRLNAKKVKAIAGFLKESFHDKKKYSIKELKEIFHNAGDIRTAQLNLEALADNNIKSEPFISYQYEVIKNDSKALVDKKRKYNKQIISIRKNIAGNLTDIKNNIVIDYYYTNIKALSNNFKIIDETTLHDSRKIIKKLLYNLKILPPSLIAKINLNKDYLDNIQDLIGKWHDTDVTLDLLTKGGTVHAENFTALVKKKQEQLQMIVKETRSFDQNVMFSKHLN